MEVSEGTVHNLHSHALSGHYKLLNDIQETRAGLVLIYLELRDKATPQDKSRLTRLIKKWIEEFPSA